VLGLAAVLAGDPVGLQASDHADPVALKHPETNITGLFFFPQGDQMILIFNVRRSLRNPKPYTLEPYSYEVHMDLTTPVSFDKPDDVARYGGTVVTPKTIHIFMEHIHDSRRIYTDGRDWPVKVKPTFSGYSIGQWVDEDRDGRYDALAVETTMAAPMIAIAARRDNVRWLFFSRILILNPFFGVSRESNFSSLHQGVRKFPNVNYLETCFVNGNECRAMLPCRLIA